MSPWSVNGTLLHMKDIKDIKYYMTYNAMITLFICLHWSENGILLQMKDIEDIKYYMTYVMTTLATQITWTFHSLHVTARGA